MKDGGNKKRIKIRINNKFSGKDNVTSKKSNVISNEIKKNNTINFSGTKPYVKSDLKTRNEIRTGQKQIPIKKIESKVINNISSKPIKNNLITRTEIRSGVKHIEKKILNKVNISKSKVNINKRFQSLKDLTLMYDKKKRSMIGVLIVNLNNIELTKECILSLNKQINLNFKIYLFDQNSNEKGTEEYLRYCENNNIIVYRNNENVPLNYVWNDFKNICNSEYLCYLNNDVVLTNTFIDDTIKIFSIEPTVGAVIHVTNNKNHLKSLNILDYKIFNDKPLYQGWDFTIRREIMPEIPKDMKIFGGDDYIFAKMVSNGYKIGIAYSSPIIHYKEKTRVNISNINEIQKKDATNFFNHLKKEKLILIDSTMNYGVSSKYPESNMKLIQNKNCVFTAVIGDYDDIYPSEFKKQDNWDYICFTDNINIKSDFWRVIYIDNESNDFEKNIKLARYYKTNFHKHLSSYDNLLWMDARITLINDVNKYLNYLNNKDIVFLSHPDASSIAEEFNRVGGDIERIEMINNIKERYSYFGYKYDNGLISSGVLLFKNNKKTIKFFNEWWHEIEYYSHRDQLSATFVLWRNPELKYTMLQGMIGKYFRQLPRNTKPFRYD